MSTSTESSQATVSGVSFTKEFRCDNKIKIVSLLINKN